VSADDDMALRPGSATLAASTDTTIDPFAKAGHDIRGSLNTVLWVAELLSETDLSKDQARLVRTLERAGNRLRSLVDQVFGGARAAGHASAFDPALAADSLDGLRVLLVDDSAESAELVRAYLEPMGVILEIVENGAMALERRKDHAFDVVLMDLNLPGMDGFDATRRLRRSERERTERPVPIIGFSADVRADCRERALLGGFTDYLAKPIRKAALEAMLSRYVPTPSASPEQPVRRSPTIVALLPKFIEHRERDIVAVREAILHLDFLAIATIGHNLRGNAASYGFPELSALGENLELAANERDIRGVDEVFERLAGYVGRIRSDTGDGQASARQPSSETRIRTQPPSRRLEQKGRGKR
jgi:CheY-like chemotaxis protein/HPt (histidine-containing phosphotransfer) domain-containing protein